MHMYFLISVNVRCKGHGCEIDQDIKSLIAAAMPLDVEVETCGVVMMVPVNGSTAAHRTTTVRRDVVRQLIAFHRETMSANGSPKNVNHTKVLQINIWIPHQSTKFIC